MESSRLGGSCIKHLFRSSLTTAVLFASGTTELSRDEYIIAGTMATYSDKHSLWSHVGSGSSPHDVRGAPRLLLRKESTGHHKHQHGVLCFAVCHSISSQRGY